MAAAIDQVRGFAQALIQAVDMLDALAVKRAEIDSFYATNDLGNDENLPDPPDGQTTLFYGDLDHLDIEKCRNVRAALSLLMAARDGGAINAAALSEAAFAAIKRIP